MTSSSKPAPAFGYDPLVDRRDGKPRFPELSIRTFSHAREKTPEQAALGDFDRRSTVSRAYRCDHHVALSRKPKRGGTEFDHREVASPRRVKRNSMVHHDERKWTAPNGSDQIGEHWHRRGGNRPHLLVNLRRD